MEEFTCQNCGKKSKAEGDIPTLLRLPLLLTLFYYPSRRICLECSQQVILIGSILFPACIIGILVLVGIVIGKLT
jgi:hypothetical protein